jgi:hypothetical protein
MITDVRSTGQDIRRTPRQISDADNAYFQVAVVADGVGRAADANPLVHSFVELAAPGSRRQRGPGDEGRRTPPLPASTGVRAGSGR